MLDIEPTTWLTSSLNLLEQEKRKEKKKLDIYSLIGPLRIGTRTLNVFVPIKEL